MGKSITDLAYLSSLITENKRKKIDQVLANRTQYITVVLENIVHPHNVSALIRSCDIFGVQTVHIVGQMKATTLNTSIAKGAEKWITLHRYNQITHCIEKLKKDNYRIVAATPHIRGYSLHELPMTKKTALLFGTEISGLSSQALNMADEYVYIPMVGFTQSFNVSVSAAICLYHSMSILRQSNMPWQLSEREKKEIQRQWLQKILHIL